MSDFSAVNTPSEHERKRLISLFWRRSEITEQLLPHALASNYAQVLMLCKQDIIDNATGKQILTALADIYKETCINTPDTTNNLNKDSEDVYDFIHTSLKLKLGDLAGLARTAISTNDQIATDIRQWLKAALKEIIRLLSALRTELISLARRDLDIVMPGYTHMQPAEAILLSHWWLANEARFARDTERFTNLISRINLLPLGANILAGTAVPIDREMVAKLLGFEGIIANSLDAVSDRDFLIEYGAAASLAGLHISQLGAELLLWSTQEFGFINLPPHMVIQSPNLPLKQNPELLEVMRSRPSVISGRLMEFLNQLKAVPSGFSHDLIECLPSLFESQTNLESLLELATGILPGIGIDGARMREIACSDLVNMSSAIDYLLAKNIDRKTAHRAVEALGKYCRARNKYLSDLALSEWTQFSPAFDADIYDHVTMEASVGAFCSFGGSSLDQVELAIERAQADLEQDKSFIHNYYDVTHANEIARQLNVSASPPTEA